MPLEVIYHSFEAFIYEVNLENTLPVYRQHFLLGTIKKTVLKKHFLKEYFTITKILLKTEIH